MTSCEEIGLRLIAGEAPASDPGLASHVGSCLRCFRTASEMRDLPRVVSLLEGGEPPDPGEEFWARFPRQVGAAWSARRGGGVRGAWRRMAEWLRPPGRAALAGAAVPALLLAFVVARGPAPVAPPVATSEGRGEDDGMSAGLPSVLEEDDPWSLLELADDRREVTPRRDPGRDVDDGALDDVSDGPSPTEEVELLESDQLPAVAVALGRL
jgi:hypothetical protein